MDPVRPWIAMAIDEINRPGKKAKDRGKEKTSREEEDRRMKDANIEEEEKKRRRARRRKEESAETPR